MADDVLAQFTDITGAQPERAAQYLQLTENNLEQAIQLFFESGGVDMGASLPSENAAQQTAASRTTGPPNSSEVINIEDDDDDPYADPTAAAPAQAPPAPPPRSAPVESDEEMARRLQEEMYGAGGAGGPASEEDIRAPMARQAATLAGPMADWRSDPAALDATVAEQLLERQRRAAAPPGIFNQRAPASDPSNVWRENGDDPPGAHRQRLAAATGGASTRSSKSEMLAEMYRPPFELITPLVSWDGIRAKGKQDQKWILVDVQSSDIFDCQVLNRDIWKNTSIQETVREHFVFKQYNKNDRQAQDYIRFYFPAYESDAAYPHVAIVDPRTGEQVKVWSGRPGDVTSSGGGVPKKAEEFLSQLHEFLDRYSLEADRRNPVATRKAERKKEVDIDRMTEDEMLQMAMQNSLDSGSGAVAPDAKLSGPTSADPDALTRAAGAESPEAADTGSGGVLLPPEPEMTGALPQSSTFAAIPADAPHEEPAAAEPNTTRIQFRHPGGRVIRRFRLEDRVQRVYEWLKADTRALGDDSGGNEFDLIFMGKNLIEAVESGQTIDEAGLKNGSIMVEFAS